MKAFYQTLRPCSHVFMTLSTRFVISNASKYICEQCLVLQIFFSIINRSSVSQMVTLILDSKRVSVLCHMGDFGCGDGGWTPVMKINGTKVLRVLYILSLKHEANLQKGG